RVTPKTNIPAQVRIARPPADKVSRDGRPQSGAGTRYRGCARWRRAHSHESPRARPTRPGGALLDRDELRAARSADAQQVTAAVLRGCVQRRDRVFGGGDRLTIDLDDDVAGLQPRAFGRAARDHVRDDRAARAAFEPE